MGSHPLVKVKPVQALPLTDAEVTALLDAVDRCEFDVDEAFRLRTLTLLQRWSGLACTDAVKLSRAALDDRHRLLLNRQGMPATQALRL
jgi:hypothetical protein